MAPRLEPQGFQDNRGYLHLLPFEYIDTFSGALMLRFVDFSFPGNNGLDLTLERVYNSKGRNGRSPQWRIAPAGYPISVLRADPEAYPYPFPLFTMWDGAEVKAVPGFNHNGSNYVTDRFWMYDASAKRLEMPNGLVLTFLHDETVPFDPPTTRSYLTNIDDPFGNSIEITWDVSAGTPRIDSVTQNLVGGQSRQVAFTWGSHPELPASISFNGRTWHYDAEDVEGALRITAVRPPVGPAWAFEYNSPVDARLISRVTMPSGGELSYDYDRKEYDRIYKMNEDDLRILRTVVLTKREVSGRNMGDPQQWLFQFQMTSTSTQIQTPCSTITEVVDGLGQLKQRDIAEGTNVLRREMRDYATIPFAATSHRALSRRTIQMTGGDTFLTEWFYNPGDVGHPYQVRETGTAGVRTTTYTYDANFAWYIRGRVATEKVQISTDAQEFTRSASYHHATGFLSSLTTYGVPTTFTPDAAGNVFTAQDAHGHTTTYEYSYGAIKAIHTPLHSITRSINPDGTTESETRRQLRTDYTYDNAGRRTAEILPEGNRITIAYDLQHAQTIETGRGLSWKKELFDGVGQPFGTEDSAGVRTDLWHDPCGRKYFESLPYDPQVGGGVGSIYSHDAIGRVTRVVNNADNSQVNYSYHNSAVDITDEEGRTTRQTWKAYGNPDDGILTAVQEATGDWTYYSYDALGNLRRVDHPQGNPRTWTYNSSNQLVSETHPESGEVTFEYDAAGLLWKRHDFHGTTIHAYDRNDRLVGIDRPGGTDHDVTLAYDDSDNRTLLRNGRVESRFAYDNGNQLTRRDDALAQRTFATLLDYDDNGNLTRITYPSGREVTQTFDASDRLASVRIGDTVAADQFSYHPSGAVTSYRAGNGIVHQMTFDARHRPRRVVSAYGQTGYLDITYSYDRVGNVTKVEDPRTGMGQLLTYDAVDRLKTVGGYGQNIFDYDKLGNRTKTTEPFAIYSHDPATNRLTSVTGPNATNFGYDGAGNTTSAGVLSFTHSPDNMMATATTPSGTSTYWYDGDGVRKYRLLPDSTAYFYINASGLNTLSEFKLSGGTLTHERDYVYAGGRLLASAKGGSFGPPPPGPPPPGPTPGFTDDPLVPQQTVIKVIHVMELRTRIDEQRVRFGLSAYAWLHHPLTAQSHTVSWAHVAQLRDALVQAYQAAGRTPPTFTDPLLQVTVTPVKAIHISEIRAAVLALFN